jgi:uncharacterized protein (TIGR00297 family)
LLGQVIAAPIVTALFAVLAYALGMVSRGGALGGFLVGTLIYACLGPQGFAILALFVLGGSLLTRLGYGRKRRAGTAEAGGGRRGARNALANCSVALVCALLAALTSSHALTAAFVASLGAAFADTAESEVGQLYGRAPRLITTLRTVPPGTDGAVSLPGTLAGLLAAALTATLGSVLGLVGEMNSTILVILAAILGTVVDSLLGALIPRLGNELTNILCTLTAALLTLSLA